MNRFVPHVRSRFRRVGLLELPIVAALACGCSASSGDPLGTAPGGDMPGGGNTKPTTGGAGNGSTNGGSGNGGGGTGTGVDPGTGGSTGPMVCQDNQLH